MFEEHDEWLRQATEWAHAKRYDDARELALRVIREDGRNANALWLVACVTDSLSERRTALRALLRIRPDNQPAIQMLNVTEHNLRNYPADHG